MQPLPAPVALSTSATTILASTALAIATAKVAMATTTAAVAAIVRAAILALALASPQENTPTLTKATAAQLSPYATTKVQALRLSLATAPQLTATIAIVTTIAITVLTK